MIGLFKITDKRDSESYVLAESQMENAFKGKFYIPPIYRGSCSDLANGDIIFGVLDDQSGFGAILYKIDDGITNDSALNLSKDLAVKREINSKGNITTQDHFKGTITLSTTVLSQIAAAMVLTAPPGGAGGPVESAPVAPIDIEV